MTVSAQEQKWTATRTSFDALVERVQASRLSFDEVDLLRESHWNLGQDARLREDPRFRLTPWNRWVLAASFVSNDAVCSELHAGDLRSIDLEPALAALEKVVGRRCVLCPADPRLVVEDGTIRLSARELSDRPRLEPSVTELERYVTHLPVHSLRAAAASEPAGDWGRRAQEQVIDTQGWLRVSVPGRKLNPLMFVAQIEGHSMDDGKSGLVDGGYAVFELWPSGTKQNLNVLVRGRFTDPETGSYAVKKYVGDLRGNDGRHGRVQLVSLNGDRDRFPIIDLDPKDDDDVTVVAKVVHALSPDQFARRPRSQERRGRRDIASPQGHADLAKQLEAQVERFFEAEPPLTENEAPRTDTWSTSLVCLDGASGGLHIEVGPLRGLWSFVRRLRLSGTEGESVLLASNVRERPIRVAVAPSTGPWHFSAVGFEDEADLSMLRSNAPDRDRVHVFRVDAEGIGREHKSGTLALGQRYRILIPTHFVEGATHFPHLEPCGPEWFLWDIEVLRPVPTEVIESIRQLGLDVGEPSPTLEWTVTPPSDWRTNARGDSYACFLTGPGPVALLHECQVDIAGEAVVCLHGATGTQSFILPVGERHLLHLGDLSPGRYILAFIHHRTAIASVRAAFEILEEPPTPPRVTAEVTLGDEVCRAQPGTPVFATSRDLSGAEVLEAIGDPLIVGPPGWPIRLLWKELVEDTVLSDNLDDSGTIDGIRLLNAGRERFTRRPLGDLIFDFAELGRVVLPHDRHRQPESVRARLDELISARGATVERLAGQYSDLLSLWFEPVCAALGFDVEALPEGVAADPPEHATVLRLFHVERQQAGIVRRALRLLVLVEHLNTTLSPQMLTWIDAICAKEDLRETLLSDGFRWATHRRTSRLALHLWDLKVVTRDPDTFVPFLHVASEGV